MYCDECIMNGECKSRCPDCVPPKPSHYCPICNNGIYNGEQYIVNVNGEYAHYNCLYKLSSDEIIKWLGGK